MPHHSVEPRPPVRIAPPHGFALSARGKPRAVLEGRLGPGKHHEQRRHSAAGLYGENTAVDVDLRTCDVGRLIRNGDRMVYATSSTSPGRRIGMKRIRSARTAGSAVRPDVRIGGMMPG